MKFTVREQIFLKNLVQEKIDYSERKIKKFEKDYKYYTEDRMNWIPEEKLGSENSEYAKEIKRQIGLEQDKISGYEEVIRKIMEVEQDEQKWCGAWAYDSISCLWILGLLVWYGFRNYLSVRNLNPDPIRCNNVY